ncbi:hypothetical protein SUDANB6_05208 [Streptomyces sp. enrichment culture]
MRTTSPVPPPDRPRRPLGNPRTRRLLRVRTRRSRPHRQGRPLAARRWGPPGRAVGVPTGLTTVVPGAAGVEPARRAGPPRSTAAGPERTPPGDSRPCGTGSPDRGPGSPSSRPPPPPRRCRRRGLDRPVRVTSSGPGCRLAGDTGLGRTVVPIAPHLHRRTHASAAGPPRWSARRPRGATGSGRPRSSRRARGRRFHGTRRAPGNPTDGDSSSRPAARCGWTRGGSPGCAGPWEPSLPRKPSGLCGPRPFPARAGASGTGRGKPAGAPGGAPPEPVVRAGAGTHDRPTAGGAPPVRPAGRVPRVQPRAPSRWSIASWSRRSKAMPRAAAASTSNSS